KLKKKTIVRCALLISGAALFLFAVILVGTRIWKLSHKEEDQAKQKVLPELNLDVKLLTPNEYSRPQLALKEVKGVVVHYTANPGSDAIDNRNYFNNLPELNKHKSRPTYASSHFIVGLEGQIVQCIPLKEMAYASNDRNSDTVSIECCHPDKSGKFNQATYKALTELVAYLCIRFDLEEEDIIRHYDVTGKLCPKYFVEHEDAWEKFKGDVMEYVKNQPEEEKKKKGNKKEA
ncbi:MAG: peptidoglycan recognition protein family protein, partial [Eubacterium sp.]|nr:peptidoglycan recognition protein family protein [Eubacterium sp.]